jgi:GT2 family glycosyltransferase
VPEPEAVSGMRLWVVIPVFNRKAETLACLQRLQELRLEAPGLKVLVADDASQDGTAEAVRQAYPDTVIVSGPGDWWWTGGMKAGVEAALAAGADAILSLNDDTLLQPGSLARICALAQKEPRALVSALGVNPAGEVYESGYRWSGIKGWTPEHRLGGWAQKKSQAYLTEAVAGACVLIPAAVFREAGPYAAEKLPHYHADLEICVRARRAGFQVWVDPGAVLVIKPNLKNVHLMSGDITRRRLGWMFSWPGGIYHPRVVLAFYQTTHPWGPVAGFVYGIYAFLKLGLQLLFNGLGGLTWRRWSQP